MPAAAAAFFPISDSAAGFAGGADVLPIGTADATRSPLTATRSSVPVRRPAITTATARIVTAAEASTAIPTRRLRSWRFFRAGLATGAGSW